jgi:lysophospholipase L1-like esterase/pimeloyl-ACP methyl ester carboxylesterase
MEKLRVLIFAVAAVALFPAASLPTAGMLCHAAAPVSQDSAPAPDRIRDESFISRSDGSEQKYVLIEPPERLPGQSVDLLIALHGHGSDRWQFIRQERPECAETRHFATAAGMLLVSPDYRAPTSWLGPLAEADLLQLIDELHLRWPVRRVLLCGGSMGGTAALAFAAQHPECVDGVVSLNGTANMVEYQGFQEAIRAAYGGTRDEQPDVYRSRSAEFFPERLTMPVAATTGGRDTLVPPDSVLRLVTSLQQQGSPVLSLHRPDGGHQTNAADTREALQFVLDQWKRAEAEQLTRGILRTATVSGLSGSEPLKIVCLGDSVTGVYYHTGGRRAWPELLQQVLQQALPTLAVEVINSGISGHTTRDGLARFDRDVLQHQPQIVVISFGLNDLTRLSESQFHDGLAELVQRCREANALPVLCTPNAVLESSGRPIAKLEKYCGVIRETAAELSVPVCDQYAACQRLLARAPGTWRESLSDEIHPNLDGHRRMAETLGSCLTGTDLRLQLDGPLPPLLPRTTAQLTAAGPVRVLVMEPLRPLLERAAADAGIAERLEITGWDIAGLTLQQLEADAKQRVRAAKPDLVLLTVPLPLAAESVEQRLRSLSWLFNWSLDFGRNGWDCVVVHPVLLQPSAELPAGDVELLERMVRNQDLLLVGRGGAGAVVTEEDAAGFFSRWFRNALPMAPVP